jgi:hypothetical protein
MKGKILDILTSPIDLQQRWFHYRLLHKDNIKDLKKRRKINTIDGYSYKPFDDRKVIFVHIPKCAGVSVNKAIFGNLAGGHTTFEQYLKIFEPKCIADYFKFTIVRNPWDRLVSAYFFLLKGGFNEQERDWFNEELGAYSSFDDFVRSWLNKKNIWKWPHFRPQYHYMLDNKGKVQLDFVGYFENIDEDFAHIIQRIGVNCALPKLNTNKHPSYTEYYTDETINIVAEVYADDIKLLGYSFDNSSLPKQLTNRFTPGNSSLRS